MIISVHLYVLNVVLIYGVRLELLLGRVLEQRIDSALLRLLSNVLLDFLHLL